MSVSLLAAWLAQNKVSHAELARRIGVTDSAVWRWAHGKRRPGTDEAFKLEEATGGEVPASSWRSKPKRRGPPVKGRRPAPRPRAARVVRAPRDVTTHD